jgi:hypothetical protein
MQRLTRHQIADLKTRLARWQPPESMEGLIEPITSDVFFNQGGLEFLRDASTASTFARLRQAEVVRLVADVWPDFEIRIGGALERFEAVEALDPRRRRGEEFRNVDGKPRMVPMEKWIADAEAAPSWVEAVCRKKATKLYSERANLLIYLNFSEYGIRQNEVLAALPAATATVKDCFETVWVLWQQKAFQIWSSGVPGQRYVQEAA